MCVNVCMSTFSNILSETTGPIKVKFHMEPPWDGGTKVCSPGHITKMAAIPIHSKSLKESSTEPKDWWPWNLVCCIGCSSTTKFVQMMNPGLTLTYFTARSNLVPYAFVKGKTIDFSETIVVYDLKLATDDQSDKKFLLTSKLRLLVSVCSLPRGYIHVLNHEKNCMKSDFKEISLKLATNG